MGFHLYVYRNLYRVVWKECGYWNLCWSNWFTVREKNTFNSYWYSTAVMQRLSESMQVTMCVNLFPKQHTWTPLVGWQQHFYLFFHCFKDRCTQHTLLLKSCNNKKDNQEIKRFTREKIAVDLSLLFISRVVVTFNLFLLDVSYFWHSIALSKTSERAEVSCGLVPSLIWKSRSARTQKSQHFWVCVTITTQLCTQETYGAWKIFGLSSLW